MNHPQELRLFSDSHLNILTQNKIGTRFLRDVFNEDSYNIDVDLDLNSNIIFNFKDDRDFNKSEIIDELNSIVKQKSNKNTIMLIRHPEKRMITGLVQDILDNLNAAIDTPFLYFHLSNKFGESNIYQFIDLFRRNYSNGEEWNDELVFNSFKNEFNTDKKNDLFTDIFNEIFYLYIKIWGDLNTWERGHNNQYLFSFYEIYRKNNNIKVFDLDDNSDELKIYLTSLNYKVEFNSRSNNQFKKLLNRFFDERIDLFRKLSTIVVERDIYFYKYLKHQR